MGAFQRTDRANFPEDLDRVFDLFPRLAERKQQKAGTMSGGEQQMVAMGRALMARPKLLLLDEPSMGLAPIFVERIFEIVREINAQGTPILLVEQNALMALDAANRGYVLETGVIALEGPAKELRENERVQQGVPRHRLAPLRGADLEREEGRGSAGCRSGPRRRRGRGPSRERCETPCVGTKPSVRAAWWSRQPATRTAPSRSSAAGSRPSRHRGGADGRRGRRGRRRARVHPRPPPARRPRARLPCGRRGARGRARGTDPVCRARSDARAGGARSPCRRRRRETSRATA